MKLKTIASHQMLLHFIVGILIWMKMKKFVDTASDYPLSLKFRNWIRPDEVHIKQMQGCRK